VRDANWRALAYVHCRANPTEALQAKMLTKYEARCIASNIARLKQKQDGQIGVALGNKVGTATPVDPMGRPELVWLAPERVHPL
jgi:hypothetical protein